MTGFRFAWLLTLALIMTCLPSSAGADEELEDWQPSGRALYRVWESSDLLTTILPSNSGWHPLYTQMVEVQAGDLLMVGAQSQLTIDETDLVGQQFRVTVNGQKVGYSSIEINDREGSHHLPMEARGLYLARASGRLKVTAEASTFHSDGNFPVAVDYQENLRYGNLIVEQFRTYETHSEIQRDEALLLSQVLRDHGSAPEVVAVAPYIQQALAELRLTGQPGDVLRTVASTVGVARFGLEMLAGVTSWNDRPISPYGGLNVAASNLFAPLSFDGYKTFNETEEGLLEFRIYGAFGNGLVLYPETTFLEALHYARDGQWLLGFGQHSVEQDSFGGNIGPVRVLTRQLYLDQGDTLLVRSHLQFGKPDWTSPTTVSCRALLRIEGGGSSEVRLSQKNVTPERTVAPLPASLTFTAPRADWYTLSLEAEGSTDSGPVSMRLDQSSSQLLFLQFGPGVRNGDGESFSKNFPPSE